MRLSSAIGVTIFVSIMSSSIILLPIMKWQSELEKEEGGGGGKSILMMMEREG